MKFRVVLLLIVMAAAALVFAGSARNEFIWDDPIVFDRQLPFFDSLGNVFFPPPNIPQFGDHYYRPMGVLSYLLDESIAKSFWTLDQRAEARRTVYHVSPIAYHTLATALVFLLGLQLLATARPRRENDALLAAAAALLFAVHPIHVESVSWMAGRSDVICGIFFMLSTMAYLRYRATSAFGWLAAAALAALGGMLTKETALGLVPMVVLVNVLVPAGSGAAAAAELTRAERRRRERDRAGATSTPSRGLDPGLAGVLAFVAVAVVYFVLRSMGLGTAGSPALNRPHVADFAQRLFGSIGWYVVKSIWPPPQSAYVNAVPGGLFVVLGVVVPLAAAAVFVWLRKRQDWRPELLALALYFCGLALSVAIALFPISKTPLAERYLYIPSAGLVLLAVFLFARLGARVAASEQRREQLGVAVPVAVAVLVSIPAALATVERQKTWSNNLAFWTAAAASAPEAGVPHLHLGITYTEHDQFDKALAEYELALKTYKDASGRAKAHNDMGSLLLRMNRVDEAIDHFRASMKEDPKYETPHYNISLALYAKNRVRLNDPASKPVLDEMIRELQTALELNTRYVKAHYQLGSILVQMGRVREGADHLRTAIQLAPETSEAKSARELLAKIKS